MSRYFYASLLLLKAMFCQAQQKPVNYASAWNRIDTLISRQGRTETALQQVDALYRLAKKENNDVQVIRSLLYRMELQQMKYEDAGIKNIRALEKELITARQPARSILNSLLAGAYWNYFLQNRWKLYNRTKTRGFKKEDIDTWDIDDFHQKIGALYLVSISEEKLLQRTALTAYDPILIKGNARYLRPTLYDLLSHRALDYFKNDERDVTRAAYNFEISDKASFSEYPVFARHRFQTTDSSSLHFTALKLFQRLILFHENDPRPDALLDVDIERIRFVHSYAVVDNKEELYLSALQWISGRYGEIPAASQAWYLQAQYYADEAARYNPLADTSQRYAYLDAKKICDNVLQQKDSSEGKSNCMALLRDITQKTLQLQVENVNVSGQAFRALVTWRNIQRVYFRVLIVDKKNKEQFLTTGANDKAWVNLLQLKPAVSSEQSLPDTKDYQLHRIEVKIDSLPSGEYALLASESSDFAVEKNPLSVIFFYVSGMACINNGPDYFVLDRETGQPLAKTDVQVWYKYFDNKQGKSLLRMGEHMITDKNGSFSIIPSKTKNNNSLLLELSRPGDNLFMDQEQYYYSYNRNAESEDSGNAADFEKDHLHSYLFTDRVIYRPGQTVYFKGIVLTKDYNTRKYKILPKFSTKLLLYDANRQKIDSLSLSCNEFGSYHGTFKLPDNLLNGEFRIEDESTHGSQFISVEEYKRPKFYVCYDTLRRSYRLGDSVTTMGHAKAYSGNPVDGASVKYRVIRQIRFPYPWRFGPGRIPHAEGMEITQGETKTDIRGDFSITFRALPDKSIRADTDPVFEYRVETDVTDAAGETRSGQTNVAVGYKTLYLSIDLPAEAVLPADSLTYIGIRTESLSGEFEPAQVNISMLRLSAPNRLIRARYWTQPDQFVMSEKEYLHYFPRDEYKD
ncbi:MAG TPA: MG2 domain-containing protein, partial [Puia sp.]|nr:MG2 domain-containing protein [Puia sp.]